MAAPRSSLIALLPLLFASTGVMSDGADVDDVLVVCDSDRKCSFHVAVRHADEGWDHYANHWRILDGDGTELGKRILHHPHVEEQPFTRSLSGVAIPDGLSEVLVEAHCSVDGYVGKQLKAFVPE